MCPWVQGIWWGLLPGKRNSKYASLWITLAMGPPECECMAISQLDAVTSSVFKELACVPSHQHPGEPRIPTLEMDSAGSVFLNCWQAEDRKMRHCCFCPISVLSAQPVWISAFYCHLHALFFYLWGCRYIYIYIYIHIYIYIFFF